MDGETRVPLAAADVEDEEDAGDLPEEEGVVARGGAELRVRGVPEVQVHLIYGRVVRWRVCGLSAVYTWRREGLQCRGGTPPHLMTATKSRREAHTGAYRCTHRRPRVLAPLPQQLAVAERHHVDADSGDVAQAGERLPHEAAQEGGLALRVEVGFGGEGVWVRSIRALTKRGFGGAIRQKKPHAHN